MISELVDTNNQLNQRLAEERAAKVELAARKKEVEKLVRDLRKENSSKLQGLLDERRRQEKVVAVETPRKIIPTEIRPTTPMTPISPIPFRLGRKRGGGGEERPVLLLRQVEVEGGKRRKVEEEVGTQVDPEKLRGIGPTVGIKVGGVAWLVGVEGVVEELGRLGIVICEGSRWLVDDKERDKRIREGKTSSTVLAMVRGGKEVDSLFHSGMWLAGRWCSIRRFLAVKPVRKVDRWRQVKVALEANRRRVEKVFGLVEAFIGEEGVDGGSESGGERVVEDKGKGVATGAAVEKEKEGKVDFKSDLKWEPGSLFGPARAEGSKMPGESKADLDWVVGLGKLTEVEVGDMGYCNSCRMMGGSIGGACKRCKMRLV